jgi:hypothetical protein
MMNPATNPAIDTLHALRDNWAAGGDMGRPDGFVAVREGVDGDEAFGGEAYAVKIELWTDDCLMDLKKQDEAAARRRGEALAKKWAKEHWPHTGYVDLGGAEGVYGATWAWDKATENELERTDPDEGGRRPAVRSNPAARKGRGGRGARAPVRVSTYRANPDGTAPSEATPTDVTHTKAFRRWFGDSKVVDAAGKPLVVFHGHPRNVDAFFVFDFDRAIDLGMHFGTQAAAFDIIGVKHAVDADSPLWKYVRPFYLSLQNPLGMSDPGDWISSAFRVPVLEELYQKGIITAEEYEATYEKVRALGGTQAARRIDADDNLAKRRAKTDRRAAISRLLRDLIVDAGYDGVVYTNKSEDVGSRSWIAFYPEQIKLADGTNTTFDPANPDVRLNPAALRKKDFLALLAVPENRKAVEKFVDVVRAYQSDSAGYKSALANRYLALPASVQDAISEPKANLKKLYRGDDGKSRARATSWTSSLDYAKLFGQYVFPYAALASHGGTINTHKLVRLLDFAFEDHDVGDDENEVVILEPVWKSADSDDGYLVKNVKGYWFPHE